MSDRSPVTIRLADETDMATVLALYRDSGLDDGDDLPLTAAVDMFRRMAQYPCYRLWIAEEAGRPVGTYALLVMDNIAHAARPCAIVEQVAVASDRQREGIGAAMMRHAMGEAEAAGCYKLALSSNLKREPAHAFYDKLGFERHGFSFWVRLGARGEARDG